MGIFLPQQDVVANVVSLSHSSPTPDPQSFSYFVQTENDNHHEDNFTYRLPNHLTPQQSVQLKILLQNNSDIFSQGPNDLGRTSVVQHHITTDATPPIRQRPYCAAPAQHTKITNHIAEMLDSNIIEPSNSPWASPVVLVKKKDSST